MAHPFENNLRPNNDIDAAAMGKKKFDASTDAQGALVNNIQWDETMRNFSPEEKNQSRDVTEKLHTLMANQDVVQLNQILRNPKFKHLISPQLQNEILAMLRTANMEKVRRDIGNGNIGAVTEEMSGRLHEVKKGYGDIFQKLAEELNKPEVLSEDRNIIAQLQGEVEEAEGMVDRLLSSINKVANSSQVENIPPPLQSMEKSETTI